MTTAPRGGDYDVIVIGGGPGGSLTASLLRRQDPDRRVLVLERTAFPRHHVGESTIPSWAPILERAGVLEKLEQIVPIRKVGGRFYWGVQEEQSWTLDFRDRETGGSRRGGYHLDRGAFDQVLLEHARTLGASVREQAQVTSATPLPGGGFRVGWTLGGTPEQAEARWVVDASGQARVLSRLLALRMVPFDDMNNFAVWGYWQGSQVLQHGKTVSPNDRWTFIETCEDGWLWHIPIGPNLASVGVVTEAASLPRGGDGALEEFYRRNISSCATIGELLRPAELTQHALASSKLLTIRDWSYQCESLCGPGWFLVGDAALFVDPILSTGLLLTANGASMAANALHTLWNDPNVDEALLCASYQETYADIGASFHRLARIWYSRNFKSSSWYWEAKRQRLRGGRPPSDETDAEAFRQLATGSFADPIIGAFAHVLAPKDADRPEAHIMAAHLFGAPGAGAAPVEDDAKARRAVHQRSLRSWRRLLFERVAIRGCAWKKRESYFTDTRMDRWTHVQFVQVSAEPVTDPFDRVVFPSIAALPDGLMPRLDGKRTLHEVLVAECANTPRGSSDYYARLEVLYRQVLQLELRGWLTPSTAEAAATDAGAETVEHPWPAPLLEAIVDAGAAGAWTGDIDLFGLSVTLRAKTQKPGPQSRVQLIAPDGADPRLAYARTASTFVAYAGPIELVKPLLDALVARLRAWEVEDPTAARALWSRHFVRHAGASVPLP